VGEALIVTNYHVVFNENATSDNKISESIKVFLYGSVVSNMGIEASFVGGSVQYDLAVLKISDSDIIKNSEISAVNIKDSKLVHAGDTAFAIGNPKADGFSVTSGIVSVDSENIDITISEEIGEIAMRVMRIDTAVNSGNSGGGLFDKNGYLIGIVNAKSVESNVENIGYAIPSSTMVAIVENIIDYCLDTDCETLQKVLLGINVQILNPYSKYNTETGYVDLYEESTIIGIPDPFTSVAYGKLMVGDKIKKIAISGSTDMSSEIIRQYYLLDILLYARIGDTLTITVERNGIEIDVEIIVTESCIVSC
jgi:serine protease Do